MNSVSAATPTVAPPNFSAPDLLSGLPLDSWAWVALTIVVLAVAAHATRQRAPIVTMVDLHDEIEEAR